MKKYITFISVLLLIFIIPVGVYAEAVSPSVGLSTFDYDGDEKFLEVSNIPAEVTPEAIVWIITPDNTSSGTAASGPSISIGSDAVNGNYSVTLGEGGDVLTGAYQITQRMITIKPNDVTEEFAKQTIKPKSFKITSGKLVTNHAITVVYSGSNNKVGETKSGISSYIIKDGNSTIVTGNYKVTALTGKLTLVKPFEPTVDPEPELILGGGEVAHPSSPSSDTGNRFGNQTGSNTASNTNSSTGSNDDTNTADTSGTSDGVVIGDGSVPLDDGLDGITGPPADSEVNNALGIALFLAAFLIIAIIVIYLIARHRNKVKDSVYH